MGKLPYPQLRNLKHFENGKTVPSYNPKLPWMGYGKILRYFTPEALIQFGIINLSPSFRISSNFEVDPRAIKAIRSKERFAPDNSGIHPIFKNTPDHWDHTSDLMYEYLKPSLRIASKILDMEVVLDFLTAVGKPWVEEEPTLLHEAKSGRKQYSFYPKPLTSAERAVTAEALIHMQDFVDFDWDFSSPLSVAAYTITRKVWDKSHKRMVWDRGMCDYAGSYSSTIKFNGEWKKFLNLDNLPGNDFVPNTDSTSRLLRTQFTLAFTMVHELVHAWVRNMRRDALRIDEVEPYCNDDRIAEPGWALMSAIFGSIGWPIANNPALALETGYAQSKFIVERITQEYARITGSPVQICRVGQLCGHTTLGSWNTSEMFPIMIATGLKYLNAMPTFDKQTVDWLPVDICAKAINTLISTPMSDVSYALHNLVNPSTISWSGFLSALEHAFDSQFERIDMREWVARLQDLSEKVDDVPGAKLLGFFENMVEEEQATPQFETSKTVTLVPRLRDCKAVDGKLLKLYMERWRADGFLT
ncbi:male sterility protein [Aureobasidium pullulans]|nr:male sterility protein [Aureobasidium pullulans]